MSDDSGLKQNKLASAIGGSIGAVSNAAASKPFATLAVVALVTVALGAGLTHVEFEENLLEILPRGHPDTEANLAVHEDFPGHYSYVNINWKLNASKWPDANAKLPHRVPPEQMQSGEHVGADNITDEVYLRALEEYYQDWARNPEYLPDGVQVFNVAWNAHVKLINYTNSFDPASCEGEGSDTRCLDEAAYAFPGTDPAGEQQFAIDWRTVYAAAPDEVSTQSSPDWDMTRSVYVYTPVVPGEPLPYNEIGALAKQAFLDYRDAVRACDAGERCVLEWNVFDVEGSGPTDAKILDDAHGTELAKEDLVRLAPLVGAFILAALWWAFRSPKAVLVALTSLVLGTVWTYGVMGYLRIPLNTLNLTIVPLILGVGIDYSIHMTNEYLEHKSRGRSDAESFRQAGLRSGFAMLIATVTTVVGLAIVYLSPSLLISQMGLLSAIALVFTYLLAIVFIPAALVAVRMTGRVRYQESALMPRIGRAVSRHRALAAVAVAAISVLAFASTQGEVPGSGDGLFYEAFGNPALNFPRGDVVREWFEEGQANFFGTTERSVESNWVILQGDLTTPEAHTYIKTLQEELRKNPRIRSDSVTSIHNLVFQWEQLKHGTPAAVGIIGMNELYKGTGEERLNPYPSTQEDIKKSLDEMYACECMSVYTSLFINPEYDISVILIDTSTGGTYLGAKDIITDVRDTIERDDLVALQKEAGVDVALGGYTAFSVLFIEGEMPWVTYMAIASAITVAAIVLIVWQDLRATLAITSLVGLTSLWWLGMLPHMGIGLAITLTLPLVFINCIGSDYGLHLIWSGKQGGSMHGAMRSTGKAVFFSAVTTLGAFALFIPMTNLMMQRSMTATTIAILAIFVVTSFVIPLFYRVRSPQDEAEDARRVLTPEPVRVEEEDVVVFARGPNR